MVRLERLLEDGLAESEVDNLRVPYLQSIEPSVGSAPWVVRWPSRAPGLRAEYASLSQAGHRLISPHISPYLLISPHLSSR